MSDIQVLMEMLQSKDANKRYEACEELRVSPSLPPEALEALRSLLNDKNSDVANAAQRAIKLHMPEANFEGKEKERPDIISDPTPTRSFLPILMSVIYVPVILLGSRVFPTPWLILGILWIIGSVIFSSVLINKKNLILAYLILFSPLLMICLLLSSMVQIDG